MNIGFQLERVLYRTEDFLRRNLRSRTAIEARKRRMLRRVREALRRVKRAGLLLAGMLAALAIYVIAITPIGLLSAMVAVGAAFLLAFLSLFLPTWRGYAETEGTPAATRLDELAVQVEEWLLGRCEQLPGRALPAADAILARLAELRPHLARLDPASPLAGDARRLIGQHLPRLVDAWLELPPSARTPGAESSRRLIESLGIVAEELDSLLDQVSRDRHRSFEIQRRFIESRYRGAGGLSGE